MRGLTLVSGRHLDGWNGWSFEDPGDGRGGRIAKSGFARAKFDLAGGDWTVAMRTKVETDRRRKGARALFAIGNVEEQGEKEVILHHKHTLFVYRRQK